LGGRGKISAARSVNLTKQFMKDLQNDYVRFVQIIPTAGTWSFTGYTTASGEVRKAMQGPSQGGSKDRPFVITFSERERVYRHKANQKIWVSNGAETVQMLLKKYIEEAPFCEGSKSNEGHSIFKLVDDAKDSGLLLDRKRKVNQATSLALEMKDEEIYKLAPMIGITSDDPIVQRRFVTEYAESYPDDFLELTKDPAIELKSSIRKGVQMNKIKKKGVALEWDGKIYADEDDFVAVLLKDELLKKALLSTIKKLK